MVLCLSQDGACTDSYENFRDTSLKGGLSNDITLNPPLFSLVYTFKAKLNKLKIVIFRVFYIYEEDLVFARPKMLMIMVTFEFIYKLLKRLFTITFLLFGSLSID